MGKARHKQQPRRQRPDGLHLSIDRALDARLAQALPERFRGQRKGRLRVLEALERWLAGALRQQETSDGSGSGSGGMAG